MLSEEAAAARLADVQAEGVLVEGAGGADGVLARMGLAPADCDRPDCGHSLATHSGFERRMGAGPSFCTLCQCMVWQPPPVRVSA